MATSSSDSGGFQFQTLLDIVDAATTDAKNKLTEISGNKDAVSISQMFEMQMRMNKLSQFAEMSTAIINAANGATVSMARNIKG